jgi:hypothetical protein
MSAPRRWKDSPTAPVGVRELLAVARAPRRLGEAAFERGERRVSAFATAAPIAAAGLGIWPKLAAAATAMAATAGVAAATYTLVMPETEHREHAAPALAAPRALPSATVSTTSAPVASAESVPPQSAPSPSPPLPVTAPAPSPRVRDVTTAVPLSSADIETVLPPPAEPPPREVGRPATSTLAPELALLEEARARVQEDPEAALARVAMHRLRYPHGVLEAERDLIELDALRRAGRDSEARTRARAWLARDPSGLHARRVRAILSALGDEDK